MAELDFPLLPVIGITGTWEGYITGAADLYNKGNNAKGIYMDTTSSSFHLDFLTDRMQLRMDFVSASTYLGARLVNNTAINCTGYSKLNVHIQAVTDTNGSSSTYPESVYLYLRRGKEESSSNVIANSSSFADFGGNSTLSLPFTYSGNVYVDIDFSMYTKRRRNVQIDRIWLS